ncbi:hypothetical protein [Sphingomonas sp.]|uniref:hypothetical protein n=1 Tax=Sphingomonas sp. TaxID=28214 RepID=UPI003CC547CB
MTRWLLAILALVPLPAIAQTGAPRVELPVREVDLPNGDRRFATTLQIDGRAVEVGIDTGSTGLRVLPRALGPAGAAAHGSRVTYSYGAGTGFAGSAVDVAVAAGAVAGTIRVMRIEAVGCTATHPDCPVAHADLAAYGVQGDGIAGQGFAAILGIRLQHDEIANPFEQLGVRRWIVELPTSGTQPGRVILNPDDAEVAAYARVDVDAAGTTPVCLQGPERICARGFFDSGAAGLRVIRAAPFRPWPNGTPTTITVGSGGAAQQMAVTIGRRDQASALLYAPGGGDTRLSLGFAPYFHWSVLYDAAAHQIGLKAR